MLLNLARLWLFTACIVSGKGLLQHEEAVRGLKMRKMGRRKRKKRMMGRQSSSVSSWPSSVTKAFKSSSTKSSKKAKSSKSKTVKSKVMQKPDPRPSFAPTPLPTETSQTDSPTAPPSGVVDPSGTWVQLGTDLVLPLLSGDVIPFPGLVALDMSADGTVVAAGLTGQVFVYQFDSNAGDWIQSGQTIELSIEALSVSSDGTRLAVSDSSGAVQVFRFNTATQDWTRLGATIQDPSAGVALALSMDGSILVTGGEYFGSSNDPTRVYQFDTNSNVWNQLGPDIVAGGDDNGDVDISADGSTIAVGFPFLDSSYARVYQYDVSTESWSQKGQDIEAQFQSSRVGASVALSADGNRLVVGDPGADNGGIVQVFEYAEATAQWIQLGSDLGQINEFTFDTGIDVATTSDGNIVTYGPYGNGYENEAHVAVFQYDTSTNTWSQIGQSLLDGNLQTGQVSAYFVSVALSSNGTILATGSIENLGTFSNFDGRVRIFTYEE